MADDPTVWVSCDDDCEQTALGFTGARAWVAGVPKPLPTALAAHLTSNEAGPFHEVPAPQEPAPDPDAPPALLPETAPPPETAVDTAASAAEGTPT